MGPARINISGNLKGAFISRSCSFAKSMEKPKRRCFISYHHENDEKYVLQLRDRLSDKLVIDYSLKEDISHMSDEVIYQEIREKMRNCSVTVVLIGDRTGERHWIDWEIWASLRAYRHPYDSLRSFKPNGLLGVFLPTSSPWIPDRLQDNIKSRYAQLMKWENFEQHFESKVTFAHWKRSNRQYLIDNSRPRQIESY